MSTKQILIVGAGSGVTSAKINGCLAEIRERGIEIIEVEKECTDLSSIIPQPINLEFTRINDIPMPFIPKAKHCQKGHKRPYKFHK